MPAPENSTQQPTSAAIAMCTYQGARFVEAQLQSLQTQSCVTRLFISDDASNDDTVSRIAAWVRPGVDQLVVQPDNVGYVRNFESSIRASVESGARYIALSDQDDLWHVDRIERGIQLMHTLEQKHGQHTPLLVHSDLRLVDADGSKTHDSFLAFRRYRITTEKNLLVVLGENGVMGNTILMNRALAELALPFPQGLHVHDYWIALLAELFGHRALLSTPTVDYRLHTDNASNTADSMRATNTPGGLAQAWAKLIHRDFKLPFKEDSRLSVLQQLLSDERLSPRLTDQQRDTIEEFVHYVRFEQSRWRSLFYLLTSGVVRRGLRYRARLCFVTLITRRYNVK